MSNGSTTIPFHHLAREWDARFNVPTQEDLDTLLAAIASEAQGGKFKYALVGGVEIGTRPYANDYLLRHVHCALVYNNRVSKASILKNLAVKQGNGYYLVPRNQTLPYSGWKRHHTKLETKVSPDSLQLYEYGNLPQDKVQPEAQVTKRSDLEKKRKLDEVILDMRQLLEEGKEKEAFEKYPRNFLTYGEKLKAIIHQKRDFFKTNGDPHIWLMGNPGSGKSALLQVVYPNYFNKNLDTKFFDRFDPAVHSSVLLQDVDHSHFDLTNRTLGVQFFKSICDEAGYPIDQKFKTPQITRLHVLITSNFQINDVLPEDMPGRRENLLALSRRFFQVNIRDLLPMLGLKLLSKYEITQLKKANNTDPSKVFIAWDYLRDMPTGQPLKTPEEYQEIIRTKFYG